MDAELKSLIDEQKKLIIDFQAKNDEQIKGKIGRSDLDEYERKYEARLAELSKAIATLSAPPPDQQATPASETKAFFSGLKKKLTGKALDELETKVMTVGDPTTGGYLAPAEFVNDIIKFDVLYSPIRTLAKVRQTKNRSIQIPKKTQSASAAWVTEIGTRSETTNPKFGLEEIPTHEMYALAKISKQDLEDTAFDLQGFLVEEFGEQFGVLEGEAFLTGNAVGKPEGILVNSAITGFTGVTTQGKVVADDMLETLYALNDRYARSATWLWKRSTTLAIAKLKNATTGDYLWQPGFQVQGQPNVLGRPYVECKDMPAEGNGAKAVAIGDFRSGYLIVDRLEVEIMVDPYTSKSTGCVEISARKRVGGQVVLPEAIKIYTLKS